MIPSNYILFFILVFFAACRNQPENRYAIKDFRKSLQPFLNKVAAEGIVTHHGRSLIDSIPDDELILLGKSENPVIRATVFSEMLGRDSFKDFDIVMDHLADTAIVPVDNGEFGLGLERIADYILRHAKWETAKAKDETIEMVLTKHNYLHSAYTILLYLAPQEKYYPYIKDMATRPRRLSFENYELGFPDIEYALYGLAKFRRPEDVSLIKNKMLKHAWKLSDISFRLMKEFPDTAYMDVLQQYHRRQFYQFSGNRPNGFSGFVEDRAAPEDFIDALVMQQTKRSAALIDTMLILLPQYTCMPDNEYIKENLIKQVAAHPCPAYQSIIERTKSRAEELSKDIVILKMESRSVPPDTVKRSLHWNE